MKEALEKTGLHAGETTAAFVIFCIK